MGLFSSIIHVRNVNREAVCQALCEIIPQGNFNLAVQRDMTGAPHEAPEEDLIYYVSPLRGYWSTILEGHFAVTNAPSLAEVARSLSAALDTYTLALMVHDDDVLYYNLCQKGANLDGYNSSPQYFEMERLSEDAIAEQRHDPQHFAPLLPEGIKLTQLQALLDKGWWSACNGGRLDADGLPPDDESGFVFEGERMTAIGDLLQLHGGEHDYPFAGWMGDPNIEWRTFHELRFRPALND